MLRVLDAPAAVLRAGEIVATNDEFRRLLGAGDGVTRLEAFVTPDAWPSTRAWLDAVLAAREPGGHRRRGSGGRAGTGSRST